MSTRRKSTSGISATPAISINNQSTIVAGSEVPDSELHQLNNEYERVVDSLINLLNNNERYHIIFIITSGIQLNDELKNIFLKDDILRDALLGIDSTKDGKKIYTDAYNATKITRKSILDGTLEKGDLTIIATLVKSAAGRKNVHQRNSYLFPKKKQRTNCSKITCAVMGGKRNKRMRKKTQRKRRI